MGIAAPWESVRLFGSDEFNKILSKFNIVGRPQNVERFGSGRIHDTFLVRCRSTTGSTSRYILQRINRSIFNRPHELMANIRAVTEHLRLKIIERGGDPLRETLTIIPTNELESFHRDLRGEYWRIYLFIENTSTLDVPENLNQVRQAARAYGLFQQALADFPGESLHETIPAFHDTARRFATFQAALGSDPFDKAQAARPEIDFVLARGDQTSTLVNLIHEGKLPLRVTHNDTKFNNVLLDRQSGEGVCVVDLDTVMPGLSLYDFGDAIRSICNTGAEDERQLEKVNLDLDVFKEFACNYIATMADTLDPVERNHLVFSARLMTLECGMRFLTDHLLGDQYFRITRQNQNLDRCRTQFTLLEELERHAEKMEDIVLSC
jgi:hypothetical protein